MLLVLVLLQLTEPRATVRTALHAVEGDSVATVAARWQARLASDSSDRDAVLGLATLDRLTYHYSDAERRYAILMRGPADRYTAYAYLGRGWESDTRDLVLEADTAFSRARGLARARHDSLAEAEALIGLVIVRASSAGVVVGHAIMDSAERLLPPPPAAIDLHADIAFRRATFDAILSRPNAAAEARQAVEIARQAKSPRAEARAWRALALVYKFRSDFDSVEVVLSRAEALQRAAGDYGELAISLIRHSEAFHGNGDIGTMRQWLLAARDAAARSDNKLVLAGAADGLGFSALQLNDYPTARARLAEALALYQSVGDTGGVHTVLAYEGDLANAVGDLERARTLYEGEVMFNRRIGDASQVFEFERALATVDVRAGDVAAAARDLDTAVALARVNHHREWLPQLDLDRSRVLIAAGRSREAVTLTTRYLTTLDTAEHMMRYGTRTVRAEAYARTGALADAAAELGGAHDELDAWRGKLADRELRVLAFQANANEVNDRDAGIAVIIDALAAGGRAGDAFALVERRRARELSDRITQLVALRGTAGSPGPDARVMTRITADSVAAHLGAHAALLEFVTGARGAPTTLIVIVPGREVRSYRLPSADSLAPRIDRLVALLEAGQDPRALTQTIGAATLGAAVGDLPDGVNRLIIVPDGPFHRLPFDALRIGDGPPLVERAAVSLVPSAGVLLALWRRPDPVHPARVLAFGDPTVSAAAESSGFTRLGESAREARLAASFTPGAVVRTGDAASAAYLQRAPLDSFSIVHFATHAIVDDRSADRTALVLAGDSGLVRPADLSALRLSADLVVLSTCRSAGGVVVDGEGVQGLTAPLLEAGARSVVATEWRIRDRAIVPFIDAFYSALARGLTVSDALTAAKRETRARGAPPRDWAAFTAVGDPLVHVAVVAPRRLPRRVSLLIIVAALGAGIAFVRNFGPRARRTG